MCGCADVRMKECTLVICLSKLIFSPLNKSYMKAISNDKLLLLEAGADTTLCDVVVEMLCKVRGQLSVDCISARLVCEAWLG